MFSNKNNLSNKEISIIMNKKNIIKIIEELSKKLPKFSDGRINYSNSKKAPVITVVVKYKDKILLLKRSDNVSTYKGKWQVVAGYLDEIKPLKEKVLEELREEIKVEENIIDKIKIGDYFEFEDLDIGKTWIVNPVLVELKEKPEIKLDREHTDFKWIKPEETKNYDIVPNLDESLRRILKII